MAYHEQGLGARLIRLPGQLLLALVNATALLVIAACVLTLIVLNRVDTASERIAGEVTQAALTRLKVTPEEFGSRLTGMNERLTALSAKLKEPGLADHWQVAEELKELNTNIAELKLAAQGLAAAGPQVTETAFEQAGDLLTKTLLSLRGCTPEAEVETAPSS